MDKQVTINLSTSGIEQLLNELKIMENDLNYNSIPKMLAEAGAEEVKKAYSSEKHSAAQGISVSTSKIVNGYEIVASGEQVAFAEFGAGVHYNPSDLYPERPEGIQGIGGYGKHKGLQDKWQYMGDDGKYHWSWGQPMRLGFVNAKAKIMQMVKK